MTTEHGIHGTSDDLHQFVDMQAKLSDGRLVRVTLGEDGHLKIIELMGDGQISPASPLPGVITIDQNGVKVKVPAEQMRRTIDQMKQALSDGQPVDQQPRDITPPQVPPATRPPSSVQPIPNTYMNPQANQQAAGPGARQANQNTPSPGQTINTTGQSSSLQELMNQMNQVAQTMPQGMPTPSAYTLGGASSGSDESWEEPDTRLAGTKTVIPRDSVFHARLESIMNDNQFDRRLTGRTRGKLDMKRLYKATTGATNLFTQKTMRRNRKYNVVIIVDESGSMYDAPGHDSRIHQAATTCQFLAEHFNRLPGVDLAVVGFSYKTVVHKNFNEHIELDKLTDKIKSSPVSGAGTNDWAGLTAGYKLLRLQNKAETTESHNILLFITDGTSLNNPQTKQIRNANKGLATEIGIGIFAQAPQMEHRIRINDINELKPQIIKMLQGEIKRG